MLLRCQVGFPALRTVLRVNHHSSQAVVPKKRNVKVPLVLLHSSAMPIAFLFVSFLLLLLNFVVAT